MKNNWMTLATLALALSPSLAFANPTPGSNAKDHSNQYHDRTPRVHDHTSMPGTTTHSAPRP